MTFSVPILKCQYKTISFIFLVQRHFFEETVICHSLFRPDLKVMCIYLFYLIPSQFTVVKQLKCVRGLVSVSDSYIL